MIERNLDIPEKQIADFCQRWHIRELALFGLVLRDDFVQE
jgi:predicted nucleotidyltransferase